MPDSEAENKPLAERYARKNSVPAAITSPVYPLHGSVSPASEAGTV